MEDQLAPEDVEALKLEVARLEQLVAEKKFDASREQSEAERASRAKQKI